MVLQAFFISFGVIFVAELGDKSQLMALAFATRYKPIPILIGITVATALVHAFSVAVGVLIGARIPTEAVNIVAGLAFLGFAWWTWRGDELDDDEAARVDRDSRSAIVAASVAFFLAELGDKTMLATITLATTHGWFGTWLGSTLGMVAAERCSPPSPWPPPTAGSAPGWARRSGWSPPTRWPFSWGPTSAPGSRSGRSASAPPSPSSGSACCCWSKGCGGEGPKARSGRGGHR
jgi:Ca2+/H+ antiporter, TMEM165/GDT1 family